MKPTALVSFAVAAIAVALLAVPARGQISLTPPGSTYTENFDTLAISGTSSILPNGWALLEIGANANGTYTAGTGSSNAGDTYSMGAAESTDRALGAVASGSLTSRFGASFLNNTGRTITSLEIRFIAEMWRRGTSANDILAFGFSTTATSLADSNAWTVVTGGNAISPAGCTTAMSVATDGNSSACRTAVSSIITGLSIPAGATFWIRWTDSDSTGNDDGLAVDDFSLTPQGSGNPSLTALPNTLTFEGTMGGPAQVANVMLSASSGNVSYVASSTAAWLTATPASGTTPATVAIRADPAALFGGTQTGSVTFSAVGFDEAVVNVTFRVIGFRIIVRISQINGVGTISPLAGQAVTTRGVVTAIRATTGSGRGFYLEAQTADRDADPNTSEGLLVFTGSAAPPACVAAGNLIQLDGTVSDFVPASAPVGSAPLTELASPANCQVLATSQLDSLPAAVTPGSGSPLQTRKWLGMRMSVPSAVVVGPSPGFLTETTAQSVPGSEFFVTLPGVSRPLREPGILITRRPSAAPVTVPSWDGNPEMVRVNVTALAPAGSPYEVATGSTVTGLSGILDYNTVDGQYQLYTDASGAGSPNPIAPQLGASPVPDPLPNELTIGSFNMERFYNDVEEANGAATLTAAAYQGRLNKASMAIRNVMRMPHIVGLVEVEGRRNSAGSQAVNVVRDIVNKVNSDAVLAGQPNPNYDYCLGLTNDPGAIAPAIIYRQDMVQVTECRQYGVDTDYSVPGGGSNTLNDRPPVTIRANVTAAGSDSGLPVRVVLNHLRSLNGIDEPGVANGDRVRAKRNEQAKYLANLINGTSGDQATNWNTAENLVVTGDFNAFEVNDGYVDVMNCIAGNPAPANQQYFTAAQAAASPPCTEILNPPLTILTALNPARSYSYSFSGSAQTLDHVLLNSRAYGRFRQIAYARNNADFPEGPTYRNNINRPERVTDHDLPVVYLRLPIDATSRTRLNTDLIRWNRRTRMFTGRISVTNTGTTTFRGPMYVFFSEVTPGVTLSGLPMFEGRPYATIDLGLGLAPGATSSHATISFASPNSSRIVYTTTRFDGSF